MKIILIRFGELTLKGKNRKEFERILYNNIKTQLNDFEIKFEKDRNRVYLILENNFDEVFEILKLIPGIHSFSIADKAELDMADIKKVALKNFDDNLPCFKVEAKRSNKNFEVQSPDIARQVGGFLLVNKDGLAGLRVDVRKPEQTIYVEIQKESAYVFHKTVYGMGGLPIGTAGKGIVLLSGGIDSPVAAIMAMKRGLKIDCVHFSSPPYTNDDALQKVKDLMKVLHKFDKTIKLHNVDCANLQVNISTNCDQRYMVTILRRMMMKIVKQKFRARVIITGESLGQVASQTIESMTVTDNAVDTLVLRPLITMDKLEIMDIAKKYNTLDISTRPFDDCCVLFVPKNPVTQPKLKNVLIEEEKFDYNTLLEEIKYDTYKYEVENKEDELINEYI